MSDSERLKAILREAKTEQERLEILKSYHRQVQVERLENAQKHADGKINIKESKELAEGYSSFQKEVEEKLISTDKGKSYLHGREAQEVTAEVHQEDQDVRKQKAEKLKQEQAKAISETKEKRTAEEVEKLPKGAEVSKEEIASEQKDGKKRTDEALATIKKQDEKQKLGGNDWLEEKLRKQKKQKQELEKDKTRGSGFGLGD